MLLDEVMSGSVLERSKRDHKQPILQNESYDLIGIVWKIGEGWCDQHIVEILQGVALSRFGFLDIGDTTAVRANREAGLPHHLHQRWALRRERRFVEGDFSIGQLYPEVDRGDWHVLEIAKDKQQVRVVVVQKGKLNDCGPVLASDRTCHVSSELWTYVGGAPCKSCRESARTAEFGDLQCLLDALLRYQDSLQPAQSFDFNFVVRG